MDKKNKPELIAPAGDLHKLQIAFQYGADAVYASTPKFSMRVREIGFTPETLKEGIDFAHSIGKKVYLTLNVFPHPLEIEEMKEHALNTISLNPDAIIVADPGILKFIKENSTIPVHLSTQANTTNQLAANFWHEQGADRIVLARELSVEEIKKIKKESKVELEAFVHGAMCMAYSGRCQISNYFTGRDPNHGQCVQACRFKYKVYQIEEDLRSGEKFPIYEDDRGSYILNSKDLCMVEHLPELIESGITSFKIEGRLKSIYYVCAVTRAYRKAIDQYFANKDKYEKTKKKYKDELKKTANRGFTTGFYFKKPDQSTNNYDTSKAKSSWGYIGLVKKYHKSEKELEVEVKNKLEVGSALELVAPTETDKLRLDVMYQDGKQIDIAHANYIIRIPYKKEVPANSFLRVQT